jgi:predicted DNA-binding transcriptional regulator YafY
MEILSMGSEVKVIEPIDFKEKIKEILIESLNNY